ncbi:hypothetical protein HPB50_005536 [Hyalomma asiaticum]|uniref:Uncharacterized protein n=1 Tax=Hyalomma asiaticum TaxID=266040 RepID=A0ACB7SN82_HYAAI|nr:hypothetical protein HPB50_005536 [Hyalomma asiaticum]
MSTGKRLAKRSILGTRVCAPTADGLHMPGVIQATKTDADDENIYTVTFPDKTTGEYRGEELIGPGFQTIAGLTLKSGQRVYVTFNGREVSGVVLEHDEVRDDVLISIQPSQHNHHITHTVQLHKRLEEVRLLESRKSARLQDLDTDYSRLAEGQSELRRRASSLSIDVPPSINSLLLFFERSDPWPSRLTFEPREVTTLTSLFRTLSPSLVFIVRRQRCWHSSGQAAALEPSSATMENLEPDDIGAAGQDGAEREEGVLIARIAYTVPALLWNDTEARRAVDRQRVAPFGIA